MKKGFTLAEVLITLVVIGIVAALTIPTLVQRFQKKELYTRFIKTYSTLTTAISLAEAEYGDPSMWTCQDGEDLAFFETYLAPYLRNYTKTQLSDVSYPGNLMYKWLNGSDMGTFDDIKGILVDNALVFSDGLVIMAEKDKLNCTIDKDSAPYIQLQIDTNGPKGPNTLGRDLFTIEYGGYSDNGKVTAKVYGQRTREYCNPSASGYQGIGCIDRLLEDGKMDY